MHASRYAPALLPLVLAGCTMTANASGDRPSDAVRVPVGATAQVRLANGQGGEAGTATLTQGATGVVIRVEATGLAPGWHGLHIHGVGTCEGPGFQSAGSHVQHGAQSVPHGLLNADGPDAGDLPNIHAGADGHAFAEVFTPGASLVQAGAGEYLLDDDGSALLIHANADDHSTQPIGGAGARVACGVITRG